MGNDTKQAKDIKALRHLPSLIQAARQGDLRTLDMASRMIARSLREQYPQIADSINEIIRSESEVFRDELPVAMPVDSDSQLDLVRVQRFVEAPEKPLLNPSDEVKLERFIEERLIADELAEVEEAPPATLIFTGPPGVGKTMSAKWLAFRLNLVLIEVDLATVVSSYLGKTGQNLRGILNYARIRPCVLFLDEFDALAKMRDDRSDLGELKRIVNVLLKEIELWPPRGVLVAATNHPSILDPAIWRRFDVKLEFSLPEQAIRKDIVSQAFLPLKIESDLLEFLADVMKGHSGSDIVQFVKAAKRLSILQHREQKLVCLEAVAEPIRNNWVRSDALRFIEMYRAASKKRVPNVFFANLFGKTEGTIRSLVKEKQNGEE